MVTEFLKVVLICDFLSFFLQFFDSVYQRAIIMHYMVETEKFEPLASAKNHEVSSGEHA